MPIGLNLSSVALALAWLTAWSAQLALTLAPAWAQADIDSPTDARGSVTEASMWRYDFFQLLLEEKKLRVERSAQSIMSNAAKSVMVVANDGNNALRAVETRSMIQYVESGGALLLIHELNGSRRADALALLDLGVFSKGPVTAISDDDSYEGFSDCVRVTNIQDRQGDFAGIRTLITNRAGWFKPSATSRWAWETVARFPNAVLPVEPQNKPLLSIGRPQNGNGGMIIVLADSSLLTNSMLWHGDNGLLALRLSELFERQGRDRFHFVRNNISLESVSERLAEQIRRESERLQPNLPKPKPTMAQMLELGNIVAKEVIDSNVLNEALQRQPRHVSPARYFRLLIILLIAGTLAWILWKVLTSRNLREMWLARRRQRHAFEIHSGNEAGDYRTAASYLAQEFCIQWTGSHHSRQWQQALATLLVRWPSVTAADRHELTRIVDIASRGCHERMLGADFQKFGKTIDALRRALVTASTA